MTWKRRHEVTEHLAAPGHNSIYCPDFCEDGWMEVDGIDEPCTCECHDGRDVNYW